MNRPPYFGYQRHSEENVVLITYRCRRVCSVRGADQVAALLRDLAEGDPQLVLARWSGMAATADHGHAA